MKNLTSAPIQKPNTYQLIADRLVREIVDSGLSAGEFVPTERELAERYGVGRSSVRESLRLLEAHKIIQPAARGSYVVGNSTGILEPALQMLITLGGTSLQELHDLRCLLEVEATKKAVENASPDNIRKLQACLKGMIENRSNPAAALRYDLEFHVALAEASGNRALLAAVHGVRGALEQKILGANVDIDEAIAQHQMILGAIISRDMDEAAAAIEAHMRFVQLGIQSP